jgi:hypothetical protein
MSPLCEISTIESEQGRLHIYYAQLSMDDSVIIPKFA